MKEFEKKHPYVWLILGLFLTTFSYGIFNTGICAWIFAIPLIRFINNRTKWSSILQRNQDYKRQNGKKAEKKRPSQRDKAPNLLLPAGGSGVACL